MSTVHAQASWGDLLSGRNAACSIALSGGVALHAINIYIATTVLPSVVGEIGGLGLYAWNTTLFVVASILGAALSGKVLSRHGAKNAYSLAALLFASGSLICALAPNMPSMLAGRTLQGFGGGFLFALGYSMIQTVFDEKLWPRAMALVSAMWGVATLLGPAIGGIFAELNAWRAAFGVLVPLTLIYLLFVWMILPSRPRSEKASSALPLAQLFLLAASVMAVSAGSLADDSTWNITGIMVAAVLIAWLVRLERTRPSRLLPKGALRFNSALFPLYACVSLLVIGMTSETFIPYFLQHLHGQTPLLSGYLAALMAAGWTVAEIMSSGWQGRGIRLAIINGPILVLIGMLTLLFSVPLHGQGAWAILAAVGSGQFLVGFGIGLGWPHLLTRILVVASEHDQDTAASSITTVQLFTTALGSALAGMIVNLGGLNTPGGIEGTANAAFWLFALFSVAPGLAIASAWRAARQ